LLSEKPEKQPLEIKGAKDIFEINGKLEDTGRIQYLLLVNKSALTLSKTIPYRM
jgi:hypothetical protein